MTQTILIDVDGVLADTHTPWLARYNRDYNDTLTVAQITRWEMHELVKPECGRKIYSYLKDPDIYRDTPLISGAREGVESLRALDFKPVFVTSGFFLTKLEWLVDNGFSESRDPHFADDVIVAHDKMLIAGRILIDDRPANLVGRILPILFDQPWNWDSAIPSRAKGWAGVMDIMRAEAG